MAGLPPGDPQLVSMIVSHLKTQGLFDQFRRDCLADVDTKPAYLNLRQRVDNFVSNHLSNHTWSPHLNKNQLRNNIRQLVLQSGMLEQGVDRIVAQVVDPKIHHTFRPQVEKVVREFLSPLQAADEPLLYPVQLEEKQGHLMPTPGPSAAPATSTANDAMSILDTITSLNQEANAWTGGEKPADKSGRRSGLQGEHGAEDELMLETEPGELDMSLVEDGSEGQGEEQKVDLEMPRMEPETSDTPEGIKEEFVGEAEEQVEQPPLQQEGQEVEEVKDEGDEGKDKAAKKPKEEASDRDGEAPSEKHHIRQKARERLKEEYSLEDSDLEGLSDITVSSVHTSDLSSFEEESEEEPPVSDSTEEGEIVSDDEEVEKKVAVETEIKERKPRGGRQAYVHKPFLYSRYYSDSDDEVTVEQRRRNAAKDKEERLLKRQQNRERMEERRRQKLAQQENLEEKMEASPPSLEVPGASGKEARKERKVLEKKVAISRKRKKRSRREDEVGNKKGDVEEDLQKKSDEMRVSFSKCQQPRSFKKISDSAASDEGGRRKTSGESPSEVREPRKLLDRNKTHSFILDLEQGSEELLRQRAVSKFDRHPRREQGDTPRHTREKERSLSDERGKHKPKAERTGGAGRSSSDAHMEESSQRDGALGNKATLDEKAEKKSKARGDRRTSLSGRESRASLSEGGASEEGFQKDGTKKAKVTSSTDALKAEKSKADKVPPLKSDTKLSFSLESTASSEDKSDIEPGSESWKKKDRHAKEVSRRSKSLMEDKNVDKSRPKSETKDMRSSERDADRKKMDQVALEHPKSEKLSSDTDPDYKTRDVESGSKVKSISTEKSRSKSREDTKIQPVPKAEKKALGPESKSKGAKVSSRLDSFKEKKREAGVKEVSKASTENLQEKTKENRESKSAPDKTGNLEKTSEEHTEPPTHFSVSSSGLETPPPSKLHPQENNTVSEAMGPTATTSIMDDTFDALSDITPELEDDEATMQIDDDLQSVSTEVNHPSSPTSGLAVVTVHGSSTDKVLGLDQQEEACSIPHEVGTSELASCGPSSTDSPELGQLLPGISLQEADLKRQEAALTLLSMDPVMSACHSLTVHPHLPLMTTSLEPDQSEVVSPPEVAGNLDHEVGDGATIAITTVEVSPPEASQQTDWSETVQPVREGVSSELPVNQVIGEGDSEGGNHAETTEAEEAVGEETRNPGKGGDNLEAETEERPPAGINDMYSHHSPEPAGHTADSAAGCDDGELEASGSRNGEDVIKLPVTMSQTDRGDVLTTTQEVSVDAEVVGTHAAETALGSEEKELNTADVEQPDASKPAEKAEEQSAEAESEDAEGTRQQAGAAAMETGNERTSPDQDPEESEIEEPVVQQQEVKESRRGRPARLVKQGSSTSKSDGAEEERGPDHLEQEERPDGRMTRKGRQIQKPTATKDPSKVTPGESKIKESASEAKEQQGENYGKEMRPRRGRPPQSNASSSPLSDAGKPQKAEGVLPGPKAESDDDSEKPAESKVPRRGRSLKMASPLGEMRSSSQEVEEDEEEAESLGGEPEKTGTPARRGRRPAATKSNLQKKNEREALGDTEDKGEEKEEEEKTGVKRGTRRGRVGRPAGSASNDQTREKDDPASLDSKEHSDISSSALKRKRSEEVLESGEDSQAEEIEDRSDSAMRQRAKLPRDNSASQSDDQEDGKDASYEAKAENEEDQEPPPEKKPARRGRPPKVAAMPATSLAEETEKAPSERKDRKVAEVTGEQQMEDEAEDEDDEETQTRATTRSATRLEAERNKPSKPSTRALSKLGGKEETSPATRLGRGQGRKREASPPPAVRTRGGQKSEEPPNKRAKR